MDKYIDINGYLLVDCPSDSTDFMYMPDGRLQVDWADGITWNTETILGLPSGNYQIIGLAKDLSEEQWKGIVEWETHEWGTVVYPDGRLDHSLEGIKVIMCKEYMKTKETGTPHYSAISFTESGHLLLKANNLEPYQCLILKNINHG